MGAKKVFFHAGTIKTGSTFIQKFFHDNREAIGSVGLDYPFFSPPRLELPRYANADFLLKEGFDTRYVAERIEASPCNRILISEEGLIGRADVIKSSAFDRFEKTAILYVRPPVDLVASWAGENALPYNFKQAEHASGRGVVPVAEGLVLYCNAYRKLLGKFLDDFAEADDVRLIIREYDFGEFFNGNIIEDILSLTLPDETLAAARAIYDDYDTKSVNEGKSRKYCDVSALCATVVQSHKVEAAFNQIFVDRIYAGCRSGDERKVIDTLSDAEIETILETLRPVYERLHRLGYGRDRENFATALAPRIYRSERKPYAPVDETEVRLAAAEALVKGYVTNAHIRTVQAHGANENTLAALREDVKQKTFAVQSLIGQRERLRQFISLARRAVEPAKLPDVMQAALASKSQFMQEPFAFALAGGRRDGFFVEIGAGDGMNLSNTVLLEKEFGWRGILSEPARVWKEALEKNRMASLDFRCVSARTGETVEFWEAEKPGTSSIAKPKAGAKPIRERYEVETVSLADLLRGHQAPRYIDFLSIDTEGTEYDILAAFDFAGFRFGFIAVEQHDVESGEIAALLDSRGYEPLFPRAPKLSKWSQVSGFDGWYALREAKAAPAAADPRQQAT